MSTSLSSLGNRGTSRALDLARVLLVHGELAPRLALQTILQAGGYSVDVAATPAEAISKLDEGRYELVLSDTEFDLARPAEMFWHTRASKNTGRRQRWYILRA